MKVEYWSYSSVKPDGTFENDEAHGEGSVRAQPGMATSGMHWRQTRSTVEAGLWMSVSTGRLQDGTMHGITLYFADENEMREFEQRRVAELR